jgi:hypothetical protein
MLAKVLLYFSTCHTIMLFGFVFSKLNESEMTQNIINHECVHIRQWGEMTILSGVVLFLLTVIFGLSPWWMLLSGVTYYAWYIVEWMMKGLWYSIMIDEWTCDMDTPYESISFEREAYKASDDSNYLENGNYFEWLKFLVKHKS